MSDPITNVNEDIIVPPTIEPIVNQNENTDDNIDYEEEVSKRGAKNLILENKEKAKALKEKSEKLKELEIELKLIKEQIKPQNLQNQNVNFTPIDELESLRLKKIQRLQEKGEDTYENIKEIDDDIAIIRETMKKAIEPQKDILYEAQFSKAIDELKTDSKTKKYMDILGDKLIEEVEKLNIPRENRADKRLLRAILGELRINNEELFDNNAKIKTKIVTSSPNDIGNNISSKIGIDNEEEFYTFCDKFKLNLNSKDEEKEAISAYKMYQKNKKK